MHGVRGHHRPGQLQQLQEFGNSRDFVRLASDRDLSQRQPQAAGPGADEVQGRLAAGGVEGPAERLAVDGDALLLQRQVQRPQPSLQAAQELLRIQAGKHAAERIVRGNAVGKLEKASKPVPLGQAELLDVDPTIRAANGGAQGDGHHVDQQVLLAPLDPRIGQIFKPCKNCHDARTCHEKALHEKHNAASVSTAHLTRGDLLQD